MFCLYNTLNFAALLCYICCDLSVDNQVSVAILLGVGCESHDAVHTLYKRRFSQAWPCPVTSHSVSLLLRKSIKPTIDLTLQIPHD